MKYTVLANWPIGKQTSCVGNIDVSFNELKEKFGNPSEGDGYKVDAQWLLDISGEFITIYNYKDGTNFNGIEGGTPTEDIRNWHIGGESKSVVEKVRNLFDTGRDLDIQKSLDS